VGAARTRPRKGVSPLLSIDEHFRGSFAVTLRFAEQIVVVSVGRTRRRVLHGDLAILKLSRYLPEGSTARPRSSTVSG
jgi:hypothetical protein